MSYDVSLRIKSEGIDLWIPIPGYDTYNITYNVRDIIVQSTGLDWKQEGSLGTGRYVIEHILKGYAELIKNGKAYKHLEPDNGYGSIEGVIRFFKQLIDAWDMLSDDFVYRDYLEYIHFWVS